MSRGLGKTQLWIIDNLSSPSGVAATLETLRWSYFESSPEYVPGGPLPKKIENTLKRATESLADRKLVSLSKRRLSSFEECVLHYPNKTLSGNTRAIRKRLLPHLAVAIEKGEIWPKYSTAENEEFLVKSMSQSERESGLLQWMSLETKLRTLYGQEEQDDGESMLFLQLLARGNELFRDTSVSCTKSFGSLLTSTDSEAALPASLRNDLLQFYRTAFPEQNSSEVQFKSVLHQMAYISKNASYTLRKEALEILHRADTDYIEEFSGTKIDEQFGRSFFMHNPKYDPAIKHLFNHSVFRSFTFLEKA